MKGKITDKGSKAPIPGVMVFLVDANGEYVENGEGFLGTETNSKGEWNFDLAPGQFLAFEFPGYPRIIKSYEQLVQKPNMVMDDASGTALEKNEIKAYMEDMRKLSAGQWMVGIGLGILGVLIILIIAKRFT